MAISTFLASAGSSLRAAPSHMLPPRYSPDGLAGTGILGFVADKTERWGGAFAFGAAKGYWREKFVWKDHGLDVWIGGALTALSALLNVISRGQSILAPHLGAVGDAGVGSYLNSRGAAWGHRKAGRTIQVLEAGVAKPALPERTGVWGDVFSEAVGAIDPIGPGADYLSDDEMMRYSAPRA